MDTEKAAVVDQGQNDKPSITPVELMVNGAVKVVTVPSDVPLLWVLREELGLPGTKFGCGMGLCGACTVHLDGVAIRSCVTPVASAIGAKVTTIEGLGREGLGDQGPGNQQSLHPLQESWVKHSVPQCGYCQSGQIMAAASLLASNPTPSSSEIRDYMAGNICRCGAYQAIHKAIEDVVEQRKAK
jgi:isoquinoline 1-oxidoreductase alpha subunit